MSQAQESRMSGTLITDIFFFFFFGDGYNYWFGFHKKYNSYQFKKKNTTNKENPDELLLFHGFPSQSISHCSSATQGNLIIFHHLKVSKEPNFNQNLWFCWFFFFYIYLSGQLCIELRSLIVWWSDSKSLNSDQEGIFLDSRS